MSRQFHAQTYVWLHVFSCAARHLSFTRCAEELHITPGRSASRSACWKSGSVFACFTAAPAEWN